MLIAVKLFGNGHAVSREEFDALASQVLKYQSELRTYQTEQVTMHEEVRKWMRRALAAESRMDARQTARVANGESPAVSSPRNMWGARARRLARIARPDPRTEEGADGGVHS